MILEKYVDSFILLNQYDSNSITTKTIDQVDVDLNTEIILTLIQELKTKLISIGEATDLFGQNRSGNFEGILRTVYQTFGGEYLYESINERAASLFYLIVKNHPFSDGNKRIGAFAFLYFLEVNNISHNDGVLKFNQNGIVALTIMIAQSDPNDKDLIIKLISNMVG